MTHIMKILALAAVLALVVGCGGSDASHTGSHSADGDHGDGAVARIGDFSITLAQLDEKARGADMGPYQALYDARRQALDAMVSDRLLTVESESRGISKDELITQEVNLKIPRATAEQIEAFYEQNKKSMRGQTLEAVSAQIQNHLASQARQQAMGALLAGVRAKHDVKISLEPPRAPVTIAANDPFKGPAGAPIQILEYSDFQ